MLATALRTFVLVGLTALVAACSTISHKNFEEVRVGMDKSTVLELIGGPQKSSRYLGRDRWLYVFRSRTEGDQLREIHFEDGRVVYVGGRLAPPVPAEEQDNMNAKAVREEDAKTAASKRQWEIDHNVMKYGDRAAKKADDQDLRLIDSLHGTDLYKKSNREKNKVAPNFEPIN